MFKDRDNINHRNEKEYGDNIRLLADAIRADDAAPGTKEPAPLMDDGLDAELAEALTLFRQLWPENKKQVIDFSQALLRIQESSGVHPSASS